MFTQFELTSEEEFSMYASLLRLYQQKAIKTEREYCIIKEIHTRLYNKIYRYVTSCVVKKFNNYQPGYYSVDDYINTAWEEVLENFSKYNGTSRLTTFTKCYIEAGIRRQYDTVCGNTYFRKKCANALKNNRPVPQNASNAISVASPEAINALTEGEISICSAEETFIQELYDCYNHIGKQVKPYELYIFKLYCGEIRGYYGKKYSLTMICTDEVLIKMAKNEGVIPVYGQIKRYEFDNNKDKYVMVNTTTEHLEVKLVKDTIKKLRNLFADLL